MANSFSLIITKYLPVLLRKLITTGSRDKPRVALLKHPINRNFFCQKIQTTADDKQSSCKDVLNDTRSFNVIFQTKNLIRGRLTLIGHEHH